MVSGLAHALLSVFNCLHGAKAYTGHAVSAVLSPYGLSVLKLYIIKRADFLTLSAAYASFIGIKRAGFYHMVKNRINGAA